MPTDDTLLILIAGLAEAIMPKSWPMLAAIAGGCLACLTFLEREPS